MNWKRFKEEVAWQSFYAIFIGVGILPNQLLYLISDFIAFLAHSVVKYRRKVVDTNLRESFPEMTAKEIKTIRKGFYRHLGNYFVETAKLSVISGRSLHKRLTFTGMDKIEAEVSRGKDVTLLLGHYGNWEWISSIPSYTDGSFYGGQIYHPLENKAADKAFLKLRSRFGAHNISMAQTLRTILGWRRDGIRSVTGYIADQAPLTQDIHLWVDFLNHDTPVFTGAERIARKLGGPVYYLDVTRIKRGRYHAKFLKITDDASQEPLFEVTRKYYRFLENNIRRQPELWLWSHRRWKRTRTDFESTWGQRAESRLNRI